MRAARLALLALAGAVLSSCATVQQNIDARTYLDRCRYEYAGLEVTGVRFAAGILIDAVDLDVHVKITNTTDRDVALDHAELVFFLDGNHVLDAAHRGSLRVPPAASATETMDFAVPLSGVLRSLGHRPQTLAVTGKLWVTLLVGKEAWGTPLAIPFQFDTPIPWDRVDAYVVQRKKELAREAAEKVVR